jgi:hypothetical protein
MMTNYILSAETGVFRVSGQPAALDYTSTRRTVQPASRVARTVVIAAVFWYLLTFTGSDWSAIFFTLTSVAGAASRYYERVVERHTHRR